MLFAEQSLQTLQPLILDRFINMTVHVGTGSTGSRGVFERIGRGIGHVPDDLHRRFEVFFVSPGKPTMKSPDKAISERAPRIRSIKRK